MQSILLIGDQKAREEKAIAFCEEHSIHPIDRSVFSNTNEEGESTSIGIQEVRRIHDVLYLKPLQGTHKAIIIHADTLTKEAQNALLKLLEEPPHDTYILLLATKKDYFLPTILSRCSIIALTTAHKTTQQEQVNALSLFQIITTAPIGERLAYAQQLSKKKEDAIQFLTQLLFALREQLLEGNGETKLPKTVQKTLAVLQTTNANPRLALEHLFLSL